MFKELIPDQHAGLVGYWKLDESSGRTAHDSSANNYHGQLNYLYQTSAILPIQGRKVFDQEDYQVNIGELRAIREEFDSYRQIAEENLNKFEKQLAVMESQVKEVQAENQAILANRENELAALREELENKHRLEIQNREEEIQSLKKNKTSISRLIGTANQEITNARSQFQQGDYQLGNVSIQFKMIPEGGGQLVQFLTKEEWADLQIGPDQLSTVEVEFLPKESVRGPKQPETIVPDVRGLTEVMARRRIADAGLLIDIKFQVVDSETDRGKVNRVVKPNTRAFYGR